MARERMDALARLYVSNPDSMIERSRDDLVALRVETQRDDFCRMPLNRAQQGANLTCYFISKLHTTRVCNSCPVSTSQSFAVESIEPVAIMSPALKLD